MYSSGVVHQEDSGASVPTKVLPVPDLWHYAISSVTSAYLTCVVVVRVAGATPVPARGVTSI